MFKNFELTVYIAPICLLDICSTEHQLGVQMQMNDEKPGRWPGVCEEFCSPEQFWLKGICCSNKTQASHFKPQKDINYMFINCNLNSSTQCLECEKLSVCHLLESVPAETHSWGKSCPHVIFWSGPAKTEIEIQA